MKIFSGESRARDAKNANPYLPWVFDASELDAPSKSDGGARLLPAIAALFDEDDTNPSASGKEAKERLLFKGVPGLRECLNEIQRSSAPAEDFPEPSRDKNDDDEKDDRDAARFYDEFRGLRASFALVIAYTATPTTAFYAIGGGASEIDVHMVELVPGQGYIGYDTQHMRNIAPHLTRHVNVVALPNRMSKTSYPLKVVIREVFSQLGGFPQNKVPSPYKLTAAGTITLPARDSDEIIECDNGHLHEAGVFREKAKKAIELTKVRADAFWHADGNNLKRMLQDMDVRKADYPCGYRSALYMTNFSKSERGKKRLVETILGFRDEDEHLSKGLVTIEFDHRYVRLAWNAGELDEDVLLEAVNDLLKSDDELAVKWAEACTLCPAGEERAADATDDESDSDESDETGEVDVAGTTDATTLTSTCPNINFAYTVLNYYMIKMNARHNEQRVTVASCSAAPLPPPFFLKILAFAGEIGARGVRYKSHDHKLVLTDMYFAFNVSDSAQVTAHGAAVVQSIGRLCTLVPNPIDCPEIRLWIPQNCKVFCDLWLAVMDELPALYAKKKATETFEQLITRIATRKTPQPEHTSVIKHFASPTGYGKRGVTYYVRADHRLSKSKDFSKRLEKSTIAADTAPPPIDFFDNSGEVRAARCTQAVRIAIRQGDDVHHAEGDEDGANEDDAALDLYLLAPQPKRIKIARPSNRRKRKEAGGDGGEGDGYTKEDQRNVRDALAQLRSLRDALPTGNHRPSDEQMMEMFAAWYRYYVFAKGEENGLNTYNTRYSYWTSIKAMIGPIGRTIFTSLECLPKMNSDDERKRVRGLVVRYFQHPSISRGQNQDKDISNMTSHVMKMLGLFPPTYDLPFFLLRTDIPADDRTTQVQGVTSP